MNISSSEKVRQAIVMIAALLILAGGSGCKCWRPCGKCSNKLYTVTQGGNTTTWFYDPQGREALIKSSTGAETSFTYTPTTATKTTTSPGNPPTTVVYNLNAQGLATSDSLGNTSQYDATGHMIEQVVPAGHYKDERTIVSGNITTESRVDTVSGANLVTYTVDYTGIPNFDYGDYFLGKENKNWKKTQSATDGTAPIHFEYELDGCGRVIKETETGGVQSVITYTYY